MPMPRAVPEPPVAAVLLAIALLPLLGAQFGYGNQAEQMPVVQKLLDPALFPRDAYVESAVGFGPRFYYVRLLAALGGIFPLPVLIHGIGLAASLALAWTSYLAARHLLGADRTGALVAGALAVISGGFSLGLAGYLRFDSVQPATLAVPAALAGFALLLARRPAAAVPFLAGAVLMHPLIGVGTTAIGHAAAGIATLVRPAPEGRAGGIVRLALSGLAVLIVTVLAWVLPDPGGSRLPDPEFFAILADFRAPHHYLGLAFPRTSWAIALLSCGLTLLLLARTARAGPPAAAGAGVALPATVLLVLLACAASLLFTDILQNRIAVTAQPFRMLFLVKWIGFLLAGWQAGRWLARGGTAPAILVGLLLVASADAGPVVLAIVLAAAAVLQRLPADQAWGRAASVLVLAGAALPAAYALHRFGQTEPALRGAAAGAVLLVATLPGTAAARAALPLLLAGSLVVAATAARDRGLLGIRALEADIGFADLDGDDADIARAAGRLSPPDALWLVPPDMEIFRSLAQRSVVVDFTSVPFADAALRDWRTRIATVYGSVRGRGLSALAEMAFAWKQGPDLVSIVRQTGADHAVLHRDTLWSGPVLYENATWRAVRIAPPAD